MRCGSIPVLQTKHTHTYTQNPLAHVSNLKHMSECVPLCKNPLHFLRWLKPTENTFSKRGKTQTHARRRRKTFLPLTRCRHQRDVCVCV